jgi:clan AA aspartic protease
MGTFYWPIALGDPQGERFEELQALVDTGATYTWVPRDILARLGHKPAFKRHLRTADNRIIERDATVVSVRMGDEIIPNVCIFGDEGSEVLLGSMTLEAFSLAPDPVNQRLVPVVSLLMSLFP